MKNDSKLFEKALKFAIKAHSGMVRKNGNSPYVLHPMEVAVILSSMTEDNEILAAGLLHDVVEDTEHTLDEIKESFGERVARLVSSENENKRHGQSSKKTWKIRKQESLEELKNSGDPAVKMIWLADKLSNMRSFYRLYLVEGAAMWNHFNQNNPVEQEWYYRTIAENISELSDTNAYKEYLWMVDQVFADNNK